MNLTSQLRTRRRTPVVVVAAALSATALATTPASAAGGVVTYAPSSASFSSPERGFAGTPATATKTAFISATLAGYRISGNVSLVM